MVNIHWCIGDSTTVIEQHSRNNSKYINLFIYNNQQYRWNGITSNLFIVNGRLLTTVGGFFELAVLSSCSKHIHPQLPGFPGETQWKNELLYFGRIIATTCASFKIMKMTIMNRSPGRYKTFVSTIMFITSPQVYSIAIALHQCQGDRYSMADACHMWIQLQRQTLLNPNCSKQMTTNIFWLTSFIQSIT